MTSVTEGEGFNKCPKLLDVINERSLTSTKLLEDWSTSKLRPRWCLHHRLVQSFRWSDLATPVGLPRIQQHSPLMPFSQKKIHFFFNILDHYLSFFKNSAGCWVWKNNAHAKKLLLNINEDKQQRNLFSSQNCIFYQEVFAFLFSFGRPVQS